MRIIKNILLPTDFSSFSFAGLEYVELLSSLFEVNVFLLYIMNESTAAPRAHQKAVHSETTECEAMAKEREELQRFIAERMENISHVIPIVRKGEPWKEIVRCGRDEKIDLIVMATHGRAGLSHLLMGSVAEKVVQHSSVPVLTVKPMEMRGTLLDEEDIEEQLHIGG